MNNHIQDHLHKILHNYQQSFLSKVYDHENDEYDLLMNVFGLTPETKRENRQYWGRELGMCWQLIVTEVFRQFHPNFAPALRIGNDEPCDFIFDKYAIDTKYRIGSGDSGTLKKFKMYGSVLRNSGYEPVFLILRTDNLPAAITACHAGTWQVYTGLESFEFIHKYTGFDLQIYLQQNTNHYPVVR